MILSRSPALIIFPYLRWSDSQKVQFLSGLCYNYNGECEYGYMQKKTTRMKKFTTASCCPPHSSHLVFCKYRTLQVFRSMTNEFCASLTLNDELLPRFEDSCRWTWEGSCWPPRQSNPRCHRCCRLRDQCIPRVVYPAV
jgi:hypothetical protein